MLEAKNLAIVSSSSANQLPFANGHDNRVDPIVVQGSVKHRPQYCLVTDCVVCDEDATRNHARHNHLIAAIVDLFLAVEKTKSDILVIRQEVQGVTVDKINDIADPGSIEGQPRKLSLFIQNLESGDLTVSRPAS
jgi:hypothetical protein